MPEFKIHYKIGDKKKTYEKSYKKDSSIEELLKAFSDSINKDLNDLVFFYRGKKIEYKNSEKINNSVFESIDKDLNIVAVSFSPILEESQIQEEEKENNNEEKKEIKKKRRKVNKDFYNDIICPICQTSAIIDKSNDRDEYRLTVLNCANFHRVENKSYNEYDNYIIDLALLDEEKNNKEIKDEEKKAKIKKNKENYERMKEKLKCEICATMIENITPPEDKLYMCCCGTVACNCCYPVHEKEFENHHMIDMDDLNYFCLKHGKMFNRYCIDCNANICEDCKEHSDHEILRFNDKKIQIKKSRIEKLKKKVEAQKNFLSEFIKNIREDFEAILKNIEEYTNNYIKIENTLINRYQSFFLNYQLLRNLRNNELFENNIIKELKNINTKTLDSKIDSLNRINEKIKKSKIKKEPNIPNYPLTESNNKYSLDIKYKIYEENPIDKRIKLFDELFVHNNKDKLSMFIDNKLQKNLEVYYRNDDDKKKIISVKLEEKTNQKVKDMSYMFNNCKNLYEVNFDNWNTVNIFSMEAMFQLCNFEKEKDIRFPDISKFNVQNLESIRAMFSKCIYIKNVPDMSKWNANKNYKLKNISMLFNGCTGLKIINFPNWSKYKITDISYLFNRCKNVTNIHNLDGLNISNVKNMAGLFNGCENLNCPREILGWSSKTVQDISFAFQGCKAMNKIEIKWDMTSLIKLNGLFSNCNITTLKNNFINNNINSAEEMIGMFYNCTELKTIPELKYLFGQVNVINVSKMFYNCKSLNTFPKNFSEMNFNNGVILDDTFSGCKENSIKDVKRQWEKYRKPKDQNNNQNNQNLIK